MTAVILDTDFLSSFLKIGRCDLIRALYPTPRVVIPVAVYRELAQTIHDLKDKDFYEFKSDIRDTLLK